MVSNIEVKFDKWKEKLLDSGKRNPLINFRDTRMSTLRITTPNYVELWKYFVEKENFIEFPYVNEYNNEENWDDIEQNSSFIKTNKSFSDTQKVLRNLRNKAMVSLEEQGINTLYLSFGFIKWTESANSKNVISSPLVLVPVSIRIESITSPYILSLHEDEIVINPTLSYKLKTDYGITLPEYKENENIDLYFDKIKELLTLDNWSLDTGVALSILSFLKINMYNDLDKNKSEIVAHPIVRAIAGDVSDLPSIPNDIKNYNFDKNDSPKDIYQIVDADASQQEAILLAKKGVSFVLQGPPGTGKSQTITNIIAESLADGKKILFVSEKMAALEVVHKRLKGAGLEPFCLTLHSYKANKRNILDQLNESLLLSEQKGKITDEAYRKLEDLQHKKEQLNDYAQQIFTRVEPLGKTIYEVNGIIANLEKYDDLIFPIADVEETTIEKLNRFIYTIKQYVSIIDKTTDIRNNPWQNTNLRAITNELRQDISYRLNNLILSLENAKAIIFKTLPELHIHNVDSIISTISLIKVLKIAKESRRVPVEWILQDNINPFFDEIKQFNEIKLNFVSLKEEYSDCLLQLNSVTNNYAFSNSETLYNKQNVDEELKKVEELLITTTPYSLWTTDALLAESKTILEEAKKHTEIITSLKNELLEQFESEIFDIEYNEILNRFKTEYTSFTKVFKSQYKQDKKRFLACSKEITKKISDETIIDTISKLRDIETSQNWFKDNEKQLNKYFGNLIQDENFDLTALNKYYSEKEYLVKIKTVLKKLQTQSNMVYERESELQNHYKFLFNGIETNWDVIRDSLSWAIEFKESLESYDLSEQFIVSVCNSDDFKNNCKHALQVIEGSIAAIQNDYVWFKDMFNSSEVFDKFSIDELIKRLDACINGGMELLEDWIDYADVKSCCKEEGLNDFIDLIEEKGIQTHNIVPVFEKRFYRLWLDAVLQHYPAVRNFRKRNQDQIINDFAELDKEQFNIARVRIKNKLINNLPVLDHFTSGVDEISTLKRELKKQRRIMPIRKLFKDIPNLLLTLKPCLMMSPLSVSLFLEADTYKFDLVIFDEASQVCTENAIGAISRGKQVIIAGDSKQLPPTNFFKASVSDDDFDGDDDYYDSDIYESILDEANMLPERTLKWHYRSRHESLIAFSNAKIYKNNLITFPSNIEKVEGYGVEYKYIPDGFYDRGGKHGNIKEAEAIVELIYEHIKKHSDKSLGVIAFGEIQQQAIDSVLRARRIENPEFEFFFKEEKDDAFFIKNLENVQGDERDTIIFSIGYAKDSNGVFRMNFGPLSKSGGERRLNVAITRAKYNVKLVGSIQPTDIDINKISSEGPKLLRSYIDFAINGQKVLDSEITESDTVEHDSPFEEAVYKYLDRKGYKLATQVGCSGYRIDMAVKHPELSGIYVLGIECDGAAYHSAKTARERDRLRQDVLENMGWKIYRIWSTDWIKDPVSEGKRLINAIEQAIKNYGIQSSKEQIAESNESSENDDEYVIVENVENVLDKNTNRYGFEEYNETTSEQLYNIWPEYNRVIKIIENEYPVHYDIICKRISPLLGNEKVTVKVRNEVDDYLKHTRSGWRKVGDFYYPKKHQSISAKTSNGRKIDYISIEELAVAMEIIVKKSFGMTIQGICIETARAYGFQRLSPMINSSMNKAYKKMLKQGKVKIDGQKLILN